MIQLNIKTAIIVKASNVINSCKTLDQIEIAKRYVELALQATTSPAYRQILDAAQPYFTLTKELKSMIRDRKSDIINKI